MHCVLVSHTHWDREWYRTFQAFRARLVDLIDDVLDRVAADPGFRFLLDGQTVVVDDYLAIRPARHAELAAAVRSGRIAIGPWFVQPDSLLPSGESHVRNLLEGRRAAVGPVSRVAYCPDSFGHPAQFPQLLQGFGLGPFVFWRGLADDLDPPSAEFRWEAPDGSAVLAHHLGEGYFAASGLPADAASAARRLETLARRLSERARNDAVLLMNGFDHAPPDPAAGDACAALARATGWTAVRGLLEDFAALLPSDAPTYRGELVGARAANLLPGVWSARLPLKLRNRSIEALLEGWAEPWAALGATLGLADERPALRAAWRALLENQAHDSIGGCSQDRVHDQMAARYDAAEELARETTIRALERIAGLGRERDSPAGESFDVAVFNPSPQPRTDVARLRLVPARWITLAGGVDPEVALHPWLRAGLAPEGYTVDGRPASLVADRATDRIRLLPDVPPRTLEFVAPDVPAFGWRRFRVAASGRHDAEEDDGREIAADGIRVAVAEDGTLAVSFGGRSYAGLLAIEDLGDRGDTYDADPVAGIPPILDAVRVRRVHEPTGVRMLRIERTFRVPAGLAPDRSTRADERVALDVSADVVLVPDTGRIDVAVSLVNTACDHRLRLLFPTGAPATEYGAATTFDVVRRPTGTPAARGWVHAPPPTFPHQGLVAANGLVIAAPGLPEAEVTRDGVIALTLVRAVGWLARLDLRTRPQPAGPVVPAPGGQCLAPIVAHLAVLSALDPAVARAAELGLWATAAGNAPLVPAGRSLLAVAPRGVVLSALKPAEEGPGVILRLLNPTDRALTATVTVGFEIVEATPVRLDESPDGPPLPVAGGTLALAVPPHALRTVRLVCRS